MTVPTPVELIAIREELGLSQRELGEALGLADAGRTVRAWEHGSRHGQPYAPSGSALAALRYYRTIVDIVDRWHTEPDRVTASWLMQRLEAAITEEKS